MVDSEVTGTWTAQYVVEHRQKCLSFLQAMNLLAVRYIEKRRYASAVISLDQVLNGLEVMHNSKQFGNLRSHMSFLSFVEGILMAFSNPEAMVREADELGRSTKYTPDQLRNNSREIAAGLLTDARDFACTEETKQALAPVLEVLGQGNEAVQRLRDEEFPNHPEELLKMYQDFNTRQFYPFIETGTSPVPFSSPVRREQGADGKETAKKKKEKTPKRKALSPRNFNSFGDWTHANGWDEEDLLQVYKRVRLRKNIYTVLSCTPLVIFFAPFYFLVSDLAEILRTGDLKAKGQTSTFTAILMGLCIMAWLFIPPFLTSFLLGVIIYLTGWGMGLGERRLRPNDWTRDKAALYGIDRNTAPENSPSRPAGHPMRKVILAAVCGLLLAGVLFAVSPASRQLMELLPQRRTAEPSKAESPPDLPVVVPESAEDGERDGLAGTWYSLDYLDFDPETETFDQNQVEVFRCTIFEDGSCRSTIRLFDGSGGSWTAYSVVNWIGECARDGNAIRLTPLEGSAAGNWTSYGEWRDDLLYLTTESPDGGEARQRIFLKTDLKEDQEAEMISQVQRRVDDLGGVTWVSVRREENVVRVESYQFGNGAVIYSATPYVNAKYAPLGEETGWYAAPMGHPSFYGSCNLDEENLVVRIWGNNVQPENEEPPQALALDWDDDGNLLLDGRTFLANADADNLEALCARLGVDLSVD